VFIYETEMGAALYVLHRNLTNEFPNRRHKPILGRTAEQQFNQHMKQNLCGYCSPGKREFLMAICAIVWRSILRKNYRKFLNDKSYAP
jgi:hypothetical protein